MTPHTELDRLFAQVFPEIPKPSRLQEVPVCDYQGYEFGAGRYPDSYCIDGLLHDADSDYLNDEAVPCPICNRTGAINWWFERAKDSCEVDDEREWDTINAQHLDNATSLVDDIRKNRGIDPVDADEAVHGVCAQGDCDEHLA